MNVILWTMNNLHTFYFIILKWNTTYQDIVIHTSSSHGFKINLYRDGLWNLLYSLRASCVDRPPPQKKKKHIKETNHGGSSQNLFFFFFLASNQLLVPTVGYLTLLRSLINTPESWITSVINIYTPEVHAKTFVVWNLSFNKMFLDVIFYFPSQSSSTLDGAPLYLPEYSFQSMNCATRHQWRSLRTWAPLLLNNISSLFVFVYSPSGALWSRLKRSSPAIRQMWTYNLAIRARVNCVCMYICQATKWAQTHSKEKQIDVCHGKVLVFA